MIISGIVIYKSYKNSNGEHNNQSKGGKVWNQNNIKWYKVQRQQFCNHTNCLSQIKIQANPQLKEKREKLLQKCCKTK